jgi:hypothetical protein
VCFDRKVFAVVLADLMDGDDLRMIQCRCRAGFALKTRDPLLILSELRRQQLQGDLPVEPKRTPVPDPPIESISVLADPSETQGRQCPVNVTFRGKITAGDNSAYTTFNTEYRFVGENNFKSDWIRVSLARGASKTVIWRRFIEAPENDRAGAFKTPGGKVKIPVYRGWMSVEVKCRMQ